MIIRWTIWNTSLLPIIAFISAPQLALAAEACKFKLYFYDHGGRNLEGKIVKLIHEESGKEFSLGWLGRVMGFRAEGTVISFRERPRYGDRVKVVVEFPSRRPFEASLTLQDCDQRYSFNVEELIQPESEDPAQVTGSLTGCMDYEGWWIRVVPMFGTDVPVYLETDVDPRSGKFRLEGTLLGVRHILIAGKGGEVITASAINVISATHNSTWPVDVSNRCSGK